MQFVELPNDFETLALEKGVIPGMAEKCELWTEFYELNNVPMNAIQGPDSGI